MNLVTDADAELFKDFIKNHDYFFITGHKEPDGDCISSCFGVKAILEHFNKPYQLLSSGPFKRVEIQRFKDDFSNVQDFLTDRERKTAGLIIVDCSELNRLGEIDGDFTGLDTFIIDHHKTGAMPENAKGYINPDSPACAFLIQLFYEKIVGPVPKDLAEILFFGLSTDTGYFRFLSPASEEVFHAAGRLVGSGVDPRKVYRDINSGKPYSTRKLLGVFLNRAERYLDGRLVITYETMSDTQHLGLEGRDSDALYSLLLSAKDVEAVVFLRQETINSCTGGFRSQDKIDVSQIAAKFGGGGHKNASGMSCDGKIDTLIPQIVKEFARVM